MESYSRRHFFNLTLSATAAAAVLASCSNDDDEEATPDDEQNGSRSVDNDQSTPVVGIISSDAYANPEPQRVAFALALGNDFLNVGDVTASFLTQEGEPITSAVATHRGEGLDAARGIYVCEAVLPTAGVVLLQVAVPEGEAPMAAAINVAEQSSTLTVGASAPTAASPTAEDPLGVNPICTRSTNCGLHNQSLTEFIGKGTPVAVLFATPARCQSQYCGPVLDLMLDVTKDPTYGGIKVVHVEIYKDDVSTDLVPTLNDWTLASEPWLFCVDGTGKITQRLDGAFDSSEIRTALDTLI